MSAQTNVRSVLGAALVVIVLGTLALLFVPGFATLLARLVADLWITVIGAIAGLFGGLFGV